MAHRFRPLTPWTPTTLISTQRDADRRNAPWANRSQTVTRIRRRVSHNHEVRVTNLVTCAPRPAALDHVGLSSGRDWIRYRSNRKDAGHKPNVHPRRVKGVDDCGAFLMPLRGPLGSRRRHFLNPPGVPGPNCEYFRTSPWSMAIRLLTRSTDFPSTNYTPRSSLPRVSLTREVMLHGVGEVKGIVIDRPRVDPAPCPQR